MPIKKLHTDLPRAPYKAEVSIEGRAPDVKPRIGPKLIDAWFAGRTHDDNLPNALPEAGPFRASWAGSCGRQIAYNIAKVTATEPHTVADHWRMDLGSIIHDQVQVPMEKAFPNAEIERKVNLNSIGIRGSAHLDMLLPFKNTDAFAAVEIKSINGMGYKMSATRMRGGPHGPRESALIQGCLSAAALVNAGVNVTELVIQYLAIELVGPDLAEKIGNGSELGRFNAEWTYSRDEFMDIAMAEASRWQTIDDQLFGDDKTKPLDELDPTAVPRYIPGVGHVVNPETGTVRALDGTASKYWQCSYCPHRSRCTLDGETEVEL